MGATGRAPVASVALPPAGKRLGVDPVLACANHWLELLVDLNGVIGRGGTRALVQHSLALCLNQGVEVGTEVGTVMRLLTQSQPSDEVLAWWLAAVDGETRNLQPVLRGVALQLLGPLCCASLVGLAEWPLLRRASMLPGRVWSPVADAPGGMRP